MCRRECPLKTAYPINQGGTFAQLKFLPRECNEPHYTTLSSMRCQSRESVGPNALASGEQASSLTTGIPQLCAFCVVTQLGAPRRGVPSDRLRAPPDMHVSAKPFC